MATTNASITYELRFRDIAKMIVGTPTEAVLLHSIAQMVIQGNERLPEYGKDARGQSLADLVKDCISTSASAPREVTMTREDGRYTLTIPLSQLASDIKCQLDGMENFLRALVQAGSKYSSELENILAAPPPRDC